MRQGDISAARAALKRAAETGDARAALALGATYDPNELKEMGAIGIKSDVAQALAWYMKAAEYGSAEAPKRIALLPQR
jgi:TPR repeat protein